MNPLGIKAASFSSERRQQEILELQLQYCYTVSATGPRRDWADHSDLDDFSKTFIRENFTASEPLARDNWGRLMITRKSR